MPIYMDRHDLASGVTAEDVAKVHQEDLKIQAHFGCCGLTYWFDEKRGTAFCLIEGPNANAVKEMHKQAHGMIPHEVIEVDNSIVSAFLGRIENPKPPLGITESELEIINESALRTIMVSRLMDFAVLKAKYGREKAQELLILHHKVVRDTLAHNGGTEVRHLPDGLMASFSMVTQALDCAVEIKKNIELRKKDVSISTLQVCIGMSTGVPVNRSPELFGQTVKLAQRLCAVADKGKIMISPELKELLTVERPVASTGTLEWEAVSPKDEEFLNNLMDIIEAEWNESDFNVEDFGKQMGLSKAQLYRKITALTGYSPNDFIKEYRLRKAAEAIEKQQGNISEIAYETGFNTPSYFTKCFLERFGVLPSSFAEAIA